MRVKIKEKVWKALLAKSGKKCAFPGCDCELVDKDNIILGELAHIEAAEPGGARYNPNQTDEEKNDYSNLIYLCPNHHTLIDKKENLFTVDRLKQFKEDHENKNPPAK